MSRNLGFPLLILLTISLGTLLYYNSCSTCTTSKTLSVNNQGINSNIATGRQGEFSHDLQLVFPDGEVLNTRANFVFGFSSPGFDLPIDQQINPAILGLREFLDKNPGQRLHIQGYFRPDESNPTAFANLGIARANQIKKYLLNQEIPSRQTRLGGELMDSLKLSFGKIWGPITWRLEKIPVSVPQQMDSLREHYRSNSARDPF